MKIIIEDDVLSSKTRLIEYLQLHLPEAKMIDFTPLLTCVDPYFWQPQLQEQFMRIVNGLENTDTYDGAIRIFCHSIFSLHNVYTKCLQDIIPAKDYNDLTNIYKDLVKKETPIDLLIIFSSVKDSISSLNVCDKIKEEVGRNQDYYDELLGIMKPYTKKTFIVDTTLNNNDSLNEYAFIVDLIRALNDRKRSEYGFD